MQPTITEIWRYPVKSMGGERLDRIALGERGVHADRMWAVRDLTRDAISTARQLPPLLKCAARYAEDPAGRRAAPGDVLEVIVTLPDGEEVTSSDPAVHARLSELIGKEVRLEPLPSLSEKERYRLPRPTKAEMREYFGVPDGEPLPDLSMLPLRKLAELSRYVTPLGAFYDAYPVHLITSASIAAMAGRAPGSDFDTRRFRPNLVVELGDAAGLPENGWCGASLEAPGATLRGEIPTVRCVMPTREQLELPADPDVLRTISANADRCLGIYATVERPGTIAVGDELRVGRAETPSRPRAAARAGAAKLRRGVLRAAGALLPNG